MNGTMDLPIRVETAGRSGRPVVLIHGFGAHSYTWRHWIDPLAGSHRLHLVDLMGHGEAPAPADGDYSPKGHAELVRRYVQGRSLERVTLVGHSLGGGVALLAALDLLDREPERLDSLVLISAASLPQELPRFIGWARIPVLAEVLLALLPSSWLIRQALRSIVHDPEGIRSGQVEAYAGPLRHRDGRRALLKTARLIVPPDLDRIVERYAGLDVPTLLLWGRRDPVVPLSVGERLRDLLPFSELHSVAACGHVPQEEVPEAALEPVLHFLERRRRVG